MILITQSIYFIKFNCKITNNKCLLTLQPPEGDTLPYLKECKIRS